MEKVNIRFHDNYTVTYQHKKILQFVPELSVDKNLQVITPNIPLLVILRDHSKSRIIIYFIFIEFSSIFFIDIILTK